MPLSRLLLRAIGARGPPAQATISSAPRLYIRHTSSQWRTREPQPPEQLAAISWCRSHAQRTNERAVRREKTRARRRTTSGPRTASSAPRLYIGYTSRQWHTRQPQSLEQPAAISWCRSHAADGHSFPKTGHIGSPPPSKPPKSATTEATAAGAYRDIITSLQLLSLPLGWI